MALPNNSPPRQEMTVAAIVTVFAGATAAHHFGVSLREIAEIFVAAAVLVGALTAVRAGTRRRRR